MCPDTGFRKEQGAGLPVALFVITVLALIVAGMSQLQESSSAAVSQQIQSQRAFFAAESGAQVAITEALRGASCSSVSTSSLSFSVSGLNGCQVTSSCNSVDVDIDGDSADETVYTLSSIGQCGSGAEQVSRTVEVRAR
jgi:MSHA biogenesis protein MshP